MKQKLLLLILTLGLLIAPQAQAAEYWKIVDARFSGTAGETLATGDAACLSVDGNIYKADADDSVKRPSVGVIGKGGASGVSVEVVTKGRLAGQSGFTVGVNVYLSATAGAITSTAVAAYPQPIGFAISATEVYIFTQAYATALGSVTGVDADFSGELTADGLPGEVEVYSSDVDSNDSAVAMEVFAASSGITGERVHNEGSIYEITCSCENAREAGTLTFDATIDGTVTGLQAVIDGTNTTDHSATQAKDADTFTAGQQIGVKFTGDASYLPDDNNCVCKVKYEANSY